MANSSFVSTLGGAGSAPRKITQATHGFTVDAITPVRYNGTNWVGAQADTAANAETQYIAVAIDADNFQLYSGGDFINGHSALSANTIYFVDPASAGAITTTEPSGGDISKPIYETLTTTTGYVLAYRGEITS